MGAVQTVGLAFQEREGEPQGHLLDGPGGHGLAYRHHHLREGQLVENVGPAVQIRIGCEN